MKRPHIFMGITTTLLAIAGVTAAKSHRVPNQTVYIQVLFGGTPFACNLVKTTHCTCSSVGNVPCVTSAQGVKRLYVYQTTNKKVCLCPAFYNAQ